MVVKDISIDVWLCTFILVGSSQASHILVVQYLPYGNTANFFELDILTHPCGTILTL